MQMKSLSLSLLAAGLMVTFDVFAERQVFTIVDGATDWTDPASYGKTEPGDIPAAGDLVEVPDNATVTVADANSFALVSGLYAVCPLGPKSTIVFDVENGDVSIDAMITSYANTRNADLANGLVVKKGWGMLTLNSSGQLVSGESLLDFGLSYDVQEGELSLSKSIEPVAGASHVVTVGRVTVAADAQFSLGEGAVTWNTFKDGVWGEGTVHCNGPMQLRVETDGAPDAACTFAGRFTDYVQYFSGGRVMLTGELSTMTEGCRVYYGWLGHSRGKGLTGVAKLGLIGEPSSVGKASLFVSEGGGGYLYLGTGEATDKSFTITPAYNAFYGEGSSVFDAGATGGIVFNGAWNRMSEAGMARLVIAGSNTVPCQVKGPFGYMTTAGGTADGTAYTVQMTKVGTGTWRFKEHPSRKTRGMLAVEEGRLEFDTLYEKGEVCSLGTSDLLTERYAGAWKADRTVDYAFSLGATKANSLYGDAATTGTLAYTGTNPVMCLDRPILMAGDGCLENATTNKFRFRGVSTEVGGGAKTLTIRTAATDENMIGDLYDTAADPLSLVKEGTGVWTLANTNSLHGSISVKEGTLVLKNVGNRRHSWFRVTIKGNHGNATTTRLAEIGLFTSVAYDNIRFQNCADYPGIRPGEVAYARHFTAGREYAYLTASNLFTRANYPDCNEWNRFLSYNSDGTVKYNAPSKDNPRSWLPVIVRFTEDKGELKYWDLGCVSGNSDTCVSAASIEGSVDGLHWFMLEDADEIPKATGDSTWSFYSGQTYVSWGIYGMDEAMRHKLPEGVRAFDTNTYDVLSDVTAVTVAGGATLRGEGDRFTIRKLRIDASQATPGRLENFSFAEEGEIEIVNCSGAGGTLPLALSDVEGASALGDWSLSVNGKVDRFSTVRSDGATITLSVRTPPLTVILR